MNNRLKILHLEDNPKDAALVKELLEREDFNCDITAIHTKDDFEREIAEKKYDLIITDFTLPSYDGLSALRFAYKSDPEIPFIFVSGTLGEEVAVESLLHGATDFVSKQNMKRFVPSVRRALREAEELKKRKQIEESLKLFRALMDQSNDSIEVIDPLTLRYIDCNERACLELGYSREELLTKQIDEIDPVFFTSSNEAERKQFEQTGALLFQSIHRRKDGTTYPVEVNLKRIQLDKAYSVAVVRDITERMKSEEKIREQAALLDIDTAAILVRDIEDNILFWNKGAELLHVWTKEEMIGKKLCEVLFKEVPFTYREAEKFVLLNGMWTGEWSLTNKQGKKIIVQSEWTLVKDSQALPKSIYIVNSDITQRRQLETQLFRSQRLESLGTLAGGIAHDFNNILGIILGHVTLLEQVERKNEAVKKHIDAITKASNRGAKLVRQMLTFARKTDITLESVALNDIVNEEIKFLLQTFPKTISITTQLTASLPTIIGDSTQLNQVILNLCINSRDAMPNGGTVHITTKPISSENIKHKFINIRAGEYVELKVSDSGTGMNEETKNHIFEPFFTTKEFGQGTGLGLAVVFGIVESHKGYINVESHVGEGTTFEIYFPVSHITSDIQKVKEIDFHDLPRGEETLLLVEDEDMLREIAKSTFKEFGYTVLTANDGTEAIQTYLKHQQKIALVITDYGLPKMNGAAVLSELKRINPAVKVLVASGFLDPEIKQRLINQGAIGIIQKPYATSEMLLKVRELMDS